MLLVRPLKCNRDSMDPMKPLPEKKEENSIDPSI